MRPVGRVGRAHGRDGSFYVEGADHALPVGSRVSVDGRAAVVERRAGTDARPLIRLSGFEAPPRGATLLVDEPLEEGEYLASDLVGCDVPGLGSVARVVSGPSCDVLELSPGGELVPFVSDAIKGVDLEARLIEVDRRFLGLDG